MPTTALDADILAALAATTKPLAEARTLPRAVYTSEALFASDLRQLYRRMWLCVAREEDLPEAGSFITQAVGGERVLVVCGDDRKLRAFHNVCRHRGSRLIDEPSGKLRGALSCPYHAWTYALDGTLVRVPRAEPGFRTADYSLASMPLECFGGFVFVNLDAGAMPLAQHFAALPDLSRYRLAELRRARRIEYEVDANWKILCENYSECYHCPLVHPQLNRISDITSGHFQSGASYNGGPMLLREGFTTMSTSGRTPRPTIPGLAGDDLRLVQYYLLYPSFMLGLHPDYVLTHAIWPLTPTRSTVVCDFLFMPEVRDAPGFDPSDAVDFWDTTNRQDWVLCERVQRGATSEGYQPGPYHPSERCVHAFDRWYAERLIEANRSAEAPRA